MVMNIAGRLFIIFLLGFMKVSSISGQDILGPPKMDSTFVEGEYSDWTFRLFSTFKYEFYTLQNSEYTVKYKPVEVVSAGVGFTYKTWVADFGLRLNRNIRDNFKRFNFQTTALIDAHLVSIGLNYSKGLEEVSNHAASPFRDDIRALTMKLEYLYIPNAAKIAFTGSQTGLGFQKKNAGSFLFGGFIQRHYIRGDSSLLPPETQEFFESQNNMKELRFRSIGGLFGYAQFVRISENFYGAALLTGGLGTYWGQKEYVVEDRESTVGGMALIKLYMAVGYNWRRLYAIGNYTLDTHFIGLAENDRYSYNLGRVKLAVGYKFYRKN